MSDAAPPWFADDSGVFLVFRVNRRPLSQDSLFGPAGLPEDPFEHFVRVLTPGWEVVTGRRHQRTWKLGGVRADPASQVLVGKLGWLPRGEAVVPHWSEEEKDWTASVTAPQGGQVMPLGFDGETRLLTVLSDRASAPTTIAAVMEKVLRENEAELLERTTEWSVEPVLDSKDFISWLESLDVIRSVSFTARLPNPEAMEDFEALVERLEGSHATEVTETMRSKREEGLVRVQDDTDFGQAIAMGEQGFATLRGKGRREGKQSSYSQKDEVARERVDNLPGTWGEAFDLIGELLKGRLRRFLDEDAA